MRATKDGQSAVEIARGRSFQAYGGLTIDGKNVYWIAQDQQNEANGSLLWAPIAGGPYYPLAAAQSKPGAVVADLRNVYWVADNFILKVAKIGGRATVVVTADGPVEGLAVDDAFLYWTVPSRGTVQMIPK